LNAGRNYQKLPFSYHALGVILITLVPVNFEDYLVSKKIDSSVFRQQEPVVWESWKTEFEQVHPNSFTAQKLYLINPIRRKYTLKIEPVKVEALKPSTAENSIEEKTEAAPKSAAPKPVVPRPVFKPKPKMN
jgi:hypothetical protein